MLLNKCENLGCTRILRIQSLTAYHPFSVNLEYAFPQKLYLLDR